MSEAALVVGVAATAFVSTHLDNLFLLVGFASAPGSRGRDLLAGYASSVAVVLAVGLAGAFALDLAADRWLRFLGLVPLGLGIWRLRRLASPAANAGPDEGPTETVRGNGAGPVFGVMLANSGDSLSVFVSILGETREPLLPIFCATALLLSALWVLAARWLVSHPALAPRLLRIERVGVPFLLVAVGLYILLDTPTDTV